MGIWTLASDESGSFDSNEPHAFLVGGVLVPQSSEASEDLRSALKECCAKVHVDYPPHATELRAAGKAGVVDELLTVGARWLESTGGYFCALVGKPRQDGSDAAAHARMLGALIELSARVAAARGALSLDLRPASRTFVVEKQTARAARRAGLHVEDRDDEQVFHGVLGTEAREALDALSRAPHGRMPAWPKVHSVEVSTAKWGGAHPGVLAADLLCNRVYTALRDNRATTVQDLSARTPAWKPSTILIVDHRCLHWVRDVDQALRREPPNLHELGVALWQIESAHEKGRSDAFALGVEGAVRVAELLAREGERRLVDACTTDKNLSWAIAQRLAGDAQGELDLKHGQYDGTRKALEFGFAGDSALASIIRGISDRELVARLHRLTLECCNHTGDLEGAERARAGFVRAFSVGPSLSLLAEALKVENLSNVALQNRLPCPAEEAAGLMARLREDGHKLRQLAEQMNQPVLAFARATAPNAPPHGEDERMLRELTGFSGGFTRSDREYGRCLGTAARSLAFAGDLDGARTLALDARTYFHDFPFDLAFNAAVLTRIELERARSSPDTVDVPLLELLLKLSGAESMRDAAAAEAALRADPSRRFSFDLLLRQLLWAPKAGSPEDSSFANLLALGEQSGIYQALSALRSHPTELIARHVAELLRSRKHKAKSLRPWFELSLELTRGSAMPTLQRLALFTERLEAGRPPEGPHGSVLNPSFEYR